MSEMMADGTPRSGLSQGAVSDLVRERLALLDEVKRLQREVDRLRRERETVRLFVWQVCGVRLAYPSDLTTGST